MPARLGQNFLNDAEIANRIVASMGSDHTDCILEIGPGRGILTDALLSLRRPIIAIEKDPKLVSFLQKKYQSSKLVTIIEGDIRTIDLHRVLQKYPHFIVVANIPYYLTSYIIRLLLESSRQPGKLILMIQKEVAERITEKTGKSSILSLAVRYFATSRILFPVPRQYFSPQPKVDSAVIEIVPHKIQPPFALRKDFFTFLHQAFFAPRKLLVNNLLRNSSLSREDLYGILEKVGINHLARPEQLNLDAYISLYEALKKEKNDS